MHMFIGYFFKGNPNSEVSRVTKAISRVQGNNKNSNPRDQDRELFIFSNMHVIHVYIPIFQWESKSLGFKSDKSHVKGPGEPWERQPQGPGQGVIHFFQICIWYMFIWQFFNGNPNIEVKSLTQVMLRVPVQVPGVVILVVHLDPRHDLCHTCKLKIWILIEKLAYKHVSYAYLKKWITSLS